MIAQHANVNASSQFALLVLREAIVILSFGFRHSLTHLAMTIPINLSIHLTSCLPAPFHAWWIHCKHASRQDLSGYPLYKQLLCIQFIWYQCVSVAILCRLCGNTYSVCICCIDSQCLLFKLAAFSVCIGIPHVSAGWILNVCVESKDRNALQCIFKYITHGIFAPFVFCK